MAHAVEADPVRQLRYTTVVQEALRDVRRIESSAVALPPPRPFKNKGVIILIRTLYLKTLYDLSCRSRDGYGALVARLRDESVGPAHRDLPPLVVHPRPPHVADLGKTHPGCDAYMKYVEHPPDFSFLQLTSLQHQVCLDRPYKPTE